MTALTIDLSVLAQIASPPVEQPAPSKDGGTKYVRVASVSAEVLAETAERYDHCRCDEMGLVAGLPVRDLIELGSGCTGETPSGVRGPYKKRGSAGHVCQRLDLVRRRYGK